MNTRTAVAKHKSLESDAYQKAKQIHKILNAKEVIAKRENCSVQKITSHEAWYYLSHSVSRVRKSAKLVYYAEGGR
jgi:hypothetical protein